MMQGQEKRILQNNSDSLNGMLLAGNNSMTELLLWALILLPPLIVKNGAGVCFMNIGLFAGITFAWLFLVKRLRSYRDLSGKEMYNLGDYFYSRYESLFLKECYLVIWLLLVLAITGALLIYAGQIISDATEMGTRLAILICAGCLALFLCILSNKIRSIIRNIVYLLIFILFTGMIVWLLTSNSASELLDTYGKLHLPGGTSTYLNILYYNGKSIGVPHIVSLVGAGLGCLGLPFLYNGAFEAKNSHSLDRGRVLSMICAGTMVVALSMWALLNVACIYPLKAENFTDTNELLEAFIVSLCEKEQLPQAFQYIAEGILILAVVCLLERIYAMIFDIFKTMTRMDNRTSSKDNKIKLKENRIKSKFVLTCVDIITVVVITGLITVFALLWKEDYRSIIRIAWEYSIAVAAPCIVSIVWRSASKAGIFFGGLTGILVCSFWQFVPFLDEETLAGATELSGGVAAFVISLAVTIIVSMFTHKKNEEETRLFNQIKLEQK